MIQAGLMLALVGMGVVYVFLILLVLLINLTSRILADQTAAELAALEAESASASPSHRRRVIAAISAAIALHRARTGRGGG
jgi:oxaloacetate decarboxylase gamma subunit